MSQIRSIFISDVHLGCRYAAADELLQFLKEHQPDYLYLVGDIVDGWRLRRRWYWPETYNKIVKRLFKLQKKGTRLFYTPGNHDEFLRHLINDIGGVIIQDEFIHVTADQRRLLVMHGDQFDTAVRHARWLSMLGDVGYDFLLWVNRYFNLVRRGLGLGYWSLSAAIKRKVKQATSFISHFESIITRYAARRQCAGVICGHIHTPKMSVLEGIHYLNTGDWVESCTALVEYRNGEFEILYCRDPNRQQPNRPTTQQDEDEEHLLLPTLSAVDLVLASPDWPTVSRSADPSMLPS